MSWLARPSVPATAAIVAGTVWATWPLTVRLTTAVPGDYGDPLLVAWAIGWVSGVFTGMPGELWDANIFFPERGTLAFSEHFIGQALLVLPATIATGNLLLAYNLAFVLTFVITGIGTFLLARTLTGSSTAGLVAAAAAAFNEYRLVYEVAHLHTLSIHWWPFALLGLHRYFATDRRRYLLGAVAALVAMNLSSVYYMAYTAPLVVTFALVECARFGRWKSARVWLELWAAAAAVLVLTLPVLLPYMAVQQRLGVARSLDEIVRFSATLDHYRVALPALSAMLVWAAIGLVGGVRERDLRWTAAAALLVLGLAFWLSLGPVVQGGGAALDWPGLYTVLYRYVPGFDALRVPARFVSIVFIGLGLLAAVGVAAVERRAPALARVGAAAALLAFLLQSAPAAFPLDVALPSADLATPPPYLTPAPAPPPIYRAVATLRPGAVVAELPFGDPWYDLRYMYFAATHRRRLLNGYSGLFPPTFLARQRVLARPLLDREAAAAALGPATHVVVHRAAWPDETGIRIGEWLEALGARAIAEADGARVYEMPLDERRTRRTGADQK